MHYAVAFPINSIMSLATAYLDGFIRPAGTKPPLSQPFVLYNRGTLTEKSVQWNSIIVNVGNSTRECRKTNRGCRKSTLRQSPEIIIIEYSYSVRIVNVWFRHFIHYSTLSDISDFLRHSTTLSDITSKSPRKSDISAGPVKDRMR